MLVKKLTIPVILDVEFLLCGGQYVTYTDNFLNCLHIFFSEVCPSEEETGKIISFSFEMQKPIVRCFEHHRSIQHQRGAKNPQNEWSQEH